MSSFVMLVTVLLNIIVSHSDCKGFLRNKMMSTTLEEVAKFNKLTHVNKHDDEVVTELIKQKTSTIVRKNFIPIEDLKKLQRVKTVEDFRREFGVLENDYRRTLNSGEGIELQDAFCTPRPTAVEIPPPTLGLFFPSFVSLHRCTGGCTYVRSDINYCAVQEKEQLNIWVWHIGYDTERKRSVRGLPWEEKRSLMKRQPIRLLIPMTNHTRCDCKCVVQASDCVKGTQNYEKDLCKCVCKDLSSTCDSTYQVWDNENCECQCQAIPIACVNDNKLWSPDTCKCECSNSIKEKCDTKKKILNRDTCECECPKTYTCPPGKEIRKYDCTCV